MFFSRLLLSVFLLFGALSCGLKIGEKAPDIGALNYSGKGYSCVGQIPGHFEDYINDRLSVTEISEFIVCLQNSFAAFGQLTRGREESTYAPDEIRSFLQKYFIKDRVISDELMHQYMVLKQVMFGGAIDRISRAELASAIEVLEDIRVEAIRMKPHLQVLNARLVLEQNPRDLGQRIARANEALNQTIKVFAKRLERSSRDYPLADLGSFLTEFRAFTRWEDHFHNAKQVPDWIAALKAFKSFAVSPVSPQAIRNSEWATLLQSMSRWYLAFLQYEVGIKGKDLLRGAGLQNTMYLAKQVFKLAGEAIDNNEPALKVSFDQADDLLEALHKLDWIPPNIRVSSLDRAMRALVTRVFGDDRIPMEVRLGDVDGINQQTIANMSAEFYRWYYVQLRLESELLGGTAVLSDTVQLNPVTRPSVRSKAEAQKSSSFWDEFIQVKTKMRPLFRENIDRVALVSESEIKSKSLDFGFYDLSIMNVLRSTVALVFRGYSEDPSGRWIWTSGISSDEMQTFYEDMRDLGIDLGLVDRRNANTGSRAFIEGKLFTYQSKGLVLDSQGLASELSFVEAMEYFAFLYSGGQSSEDIFADLQICPQGPLDINGKPKLEGGCVLRELPRLLNKNLKNMPHLLDYLAKQNPLVQSEYAQVLLETATKVKRPDWVEHNEITTLTVIMHYAEAVMTRYDSNHDGLLDNQELEGAFEIFKGYIQKIARDQMAYNLWGFEARGAFLYILDKKQLPGVTSLPSIYWDEIHGPQLQVDRLQLAQVFRAIIAALMTTARKVPVNTQDSACDNSHGSSLPNCTRETIFPFSSIQW